MSLVIGRQLICAILSSCLIATGWRPATAAAEPSVSVEDTYEIGVEAYVYFYPLVMTDVTRRQQVLSNTFVHFRSFPSADFKLVVRPNFDTLYSVAWLDLTQGPMIVSAPDTAGRYYLLPMMDMWSDVFAAPGSRTSGTHASHFAVVPAGWSGQLPADVTRIDAPTPHVWIIGRTQTNGPDDYAAVHQIQDGYTIVPLSQWGQAPTSRPLSINPGGLKAPPPLAVVNEMAPLEYFARAVELTKLNPPHLTDWSIIARLKRIGIEAGRSYAPERLDAPIRDALKRAAADGLARIRAKVPTLARVVNGWQMNTDTVGVYGDYYLKRAVIASVLLGANQPEDAIYPLLVTDADGNAPTGDQRYVLHFAKDALPPVGAFWSLTMYDADGFPVANAINRFALGDRDRLKYNADGTLDIYIQHDDPGGEQSANWLPSPAAGRLGLTLRLYAPKAAVLDGSWAPPPVRRVP